jgi:hypothetical protein
LKKRLTFVILVILEKEEKPIMVSWEWGKSFRAIVVAWEGGRGWTKWKWRDTRPNFWFWIIYPACYHNSRLQVCSWIIEKMKKRNDGSVIGGESERNIGTICSSWDVKTEASLPKTRPVIYSSLYQWLK